MVISLNWQLTGYVFHSHQLHFKAATVIKQYNLLLAKKCWCAVARKIKSLAVLGTGGSALYPKLLWSISHNGVPGSKFYCLHALADSNSTFGSGRKHEFSSGLGWGYLPGLPTPPVALYFGHGRLGRCCGSCPLPESWWCTATHRFLLKGHELYPAKLLYYTSRVASRYFHTATFLSLPSW